MKVFVAVDETMGMMFGARRQSQDSKLRQFMLEKAMGEPLWMNEYSASQFIKEDQEKLSVEEAFLQNAPETAFCFVENLSLLPHDKKIDTLYVCKWNRHYPSTMNLDLIPNKVAWKMENVHEFTGTSHEKITIEKWEKL